MRIRLIALPKRGELEEFDLHLYRLGEAYDLPSQLASVLLIGGYAELAPPVRRETAADTGRSKS
jgi:hypothetical protein